MTTKSMRQQFADTMLEVGLEDGNLLVLVGDISHFILQPFARECPGRYYNVGICEPTIISMAAGLAKMGFFPVVHTIAPFIIERGFEQIKLDFCYQQLGGNLITVGSVFDYANLGCTHHCYGDFALLKTLPGVQITYPGSAVEFDTLFRQAYRNGVLTLYRLPGTMHDQSFSSSEIQFGNGLKITEGNKLTLIATGPHLKTALIARDTLQGRGWDPEILYIHTIRPLDVDLIVASVQKTGRVLVVEEHMRSGGLGDDVLRIVTHLPGVQFSSLAIPDIFITGYGSYQELCRDVGFTPEGLVNCVEQSFGRPDAVRQKVGYER